MECADTVNQYIDLNKPWILAKDDTKSEEVHAICTMGLNLFRIIMTYLQPVLPLMAAEATLFLNDEPCSLKALAQPLLSHKIAQFKPLMMRVEQGAIDALLADTKAALRDAT